MIVNFEDVDVDSYDVLVVLGGCVLEYFFFDENVLNLVKKFESVYKLIVFICYG